MHKNKKSKKNKKRFVFLPFLPETDAFSTRLRLEVQRPFLQICENFGPTIGMFHLHKYKFAKVHFLKLAKYEKDAFAYNTTWWGPSCPMQGRIAFSEAYYASLPIVLPMCYLSCSGHTSCSPSEAPRVALRKPLPSLRQYIFPVATDSKQEAGSP
jgi:hypothetical protein